MNDRTTGFLMLAVPFLIVAGILFTLRPGLKPSIESTTARENGISDDGTGLARNPNAGRVLAILDEMNEEEAQKLEKKGRLNIPKAAALGRWDRMKTLIETHKESVNDVDDNGDTALGIAAFAQKEDIVLLLLKSGAKVDVGSKNGLTPLALTRSTSISKLLIEYGADVNSRASGMDNRTPLHWAAAEGDIERVKLLVEHGSDVKAKAGNGITPLHLSLTVEIAAILVERGADLNAIGDGGTPLDVAREMGHTEVATYLSNIPH